MAEHAGAAMRRRQRRLRQWLRHERLSVAMALAETNHHAAPRGQTKARAGGEARVALHGHVSEAPLPQGSRPPCLGEPWGPQARIQQRTMEQLAEVVPMVQILDTPVSQMIEQLPDVIRFFDTLLPVPEQAIEVPKIVLDDVPVRTSVRTAGGSADDHILFFPAADYGAARRHSSSSSWWAEFWSSRFSSRTEFNSVVFQETHF